MVIELVVSWRRDTRVYRLADAVADMGCGIAQQLVSNLLGGWVTITCYTWVFQHRWWSIPSGWVSWLCALVGVEFAYYWWHRLSHEVNLLWAAHAVHHHSEDYNLAVALRQSVTTWVTTLPFWLPLAVIGIEPTPFAVVLGLTTLYQFWIHTELIGSLGVLEKWLNTPALHRVHHAVNPRYLDKNHGATFCVFDRLFGTWQPEEEPCRYGTTTPLRSFNPLWAQVERYVDLWRVARRAPTVLEGVGVFFASPASRPSWASVRPQVTVAGEKYDARASVMLERYVLAQWLVVLAATFAFLMWGLAMPWPWKMAGAGWLVVSTAALPGLLEKKRWAMPLEVARYGWALAVPVALWV